VFALNNQSLSKANEITKIPELSGVLDMAGYLITIDSIGQHRKTC
jgi:predicted transposase YbfD/YdcC